MTMVTVMVVAIKPLSANTPHGSPGCPRYYSGTAASVRAPVLLLLLLTVMKECVADLLTGAC